MPQGQDPKASHRRQPAGNRPAREDARVEPPRRIPKLLRFLGIHLALGAAIGMIVASGMVMINLAGMKDLLVETSEPYVPMFMLYAFNMLTFGSVSMGIGVMTLPFDETAEADKKPYQEDPPLS